MRELTREEMEPLRNPDGEDIPSFPRMIQCEECEGDAPRTAPAPGELSMVPMYRYGDPLDPKTFNPIGHRLRAYYTCKDCGHDVGYRIGARI